MASRRDPGALRHAHGARRPATGPRAQRRAGGSLNKPGYLRFDFNWQGALSSAEGRIEAVTNDAVGSDFPVNTFVTDLPKAKAMGAMALFGENYGDEVRVVEIGGPFSMELCGGTHVEHSSQIGPVTLLGESSVGSGVRRVEAFVGLDSYKYLAKERALLAGVAVLAEGALRRGARARGATRGAARVAEKELESTKIAAVLASAGTFAEQAERVGAVRLVAAAAPEGVAGDLRTLATDIRGRLGSEAAVVVLLGNVEGKAPFVVTVNKAAQDLGFKAGDLVAAFGPIIAGSRRWQAGDGTGRGLGSVGYPDRFDRGPCPGGRTRRLMTTPGSSSEESADRPDPGTDPGRGRRIAIDVGSVRIGVASSDPDGILATPVETVARAKSGGRTGGPPADIAQNRRHCAGIRSGGGGHRPATHPARRKRHRGGDRA